MNRLPDTIETFTGHPFDFHKPVVRVEDIAHGLSNTCRFAGQPDRFLSVAEHSVLVMRLVTAMQPSLARAGLFHDAHEAYIGDLATPLKPLVGPAYGAIAQRIDDAVAALVGCPANDFKHSIVKAADDLAVAFEASQLMSGPGWSFTRRMRHTQASALWPEPLGLVPASAEKLFLAAAEELA